MTEDKKTVSTDRLELLLLRKNVSTLLKTIAHELDYQQVTLKTVTAEKLRDIAFTMTFPERDQ